MGIRVFFVALVSAFLVSAQALAQEVSPGKEFYQNDDYENAVPLLNTECEGGNFDSCHTLGIIRSNDFLPFFDGPASVKLFEKACNGGIIDACADLGFAYENGLGIDANIDEALDLYFKSCENKHGFACMLAYDLLVKYWQEVPEDFNQTLLNQYAQKGCENDYGEACFVWGKINLEGTGMVANKAKAIEIFKKGAALEDYDSTQILKSLQN